MAKNIVGFEITELRLGLTSSLEKNAKKRAFSEILDDQNSSNEDRKAPKKTQVVGWPPVCAYRKKNNVQEKKHYIKVSMDGAPFLRKVDLSNHDGYSGLVTDFEKLFGCFGIGKLLMESEHSEYIPIYEDKDGDWMLLGDVPWEMFRESCKRLRIMKRSDVKGVMLQSRDSERSPHCPEKKWL